MSESLEQLKTRLEQMIKIGKLKAEYKDLILEIEALKAKAYTSRLIYGGGWGVGANGNILDEYEILDANGGLFYLTLEETCSYLQNLIQQNNK